MYRRITIVLSIEDKAKLLTISKRYYRDPPQQAAYYIHEALEKIELSESEIEEVKYRIAQEEKLRDR